MLFFRHLHPSRAVLSLATVALTFGLGADHVDAQGFFDDPMTRHQAVERYRSPTWGELDWQPSPVMEAIIAGGGTYMMMLAAASNFHDEVTGPSHFTRAMALAIADQVQPKTKAVRLADYQLKHRRQPDAVAVWRDREKLGDALWQLAWKAQAAAGESKAGLLLLDLAAAFDPSEPDSMRRYRALSDEQMELRWLATVRLPEGIDAPDITDEAAIVASDSPNNSEHTSTPEPDPEPAPFKFAFDRASILVPGADGGLVRLVAEVVAHDPKALAKRYEAANRQAAREQKDKGGDAGARYVMPALAVDFQVGTANSDFAIPITGDLVTARSEFLRSRPGIDILPGTGVEFSIEKGGNPSQGKLLSSAAGVLLESMARGLPLAKNAASAGALGFGSSLLPGDAPLSSALREAPEGSISKAVLAVADAAANEIADMAALGDFKLLTDIQVIACRTTSDALKILCEETEADYQRAFELFSQISHAAQRTPLHTLLGNPIVHSRLREVVTLCPAHLSASALLKSCAKDGRANTASLEGSLTRLRQLELEVRDWVLGHLGATGGDAELSDAACAVALAELRFLRPRLHPQSRDYADDMSELVEDLRSSMRSGTVTTRRADGLRDSLDSLSLQVASMGLVEP